MKQTLIALLVAALLEVGGDAAMRRGLIRSAWPLIAVGAVMLVAYGLVVNLNRTVDFGRLMGLYITVFFLVSQTLSTLIFGERPPVSLIVGGGFIVVGGIIIQAGTR